MAVTYKVLVIKVDTNSQRYGMNGAPEGVVLFEAGSPSADRLLGYAPGEVEAALVEAAMRDEAERMPQRVMQGAAGEPEAEDTETASTGGEPQYDPAPPAEAAPSTTEPAPRQRKPRRTRAQIEADRLAAEAAAAAPAPEPASVPDPPADPDDKVYGTDTATPAGVAITTTTFEGAAPVPAAEPVTEPAPVPAAPFNPFARR